MNRYFLPLCDPNAPETRQADEIYRESFEDDERVPFERVMAEACHPEPGQTGHFGVVIDQGQVVAMGSSRYFRAENVGYLDYIAVRPDARGSGVGSWLCNQLFDWVETQARRFIGDLPRFTFLEVRNPIDAPDPEERDHRLARVRFYQKLGADALPIDYVCPPVGDGFPEVPYLLMVRTYPPGKLIRRMDALDLVRLGLVSVNQAEPRGPLVTSALMSVDRYWPTSGPLRGMPPKPGTSH
jgi:GNAT superfamily N-acetyltransferase